MTLEKQIINKFVEVYNSVVSTNKITSINVYIDDVNTTKDEKEFRLVIVDTNNILEGCSVTFNRQTNKLSVKIKDHIGSFDDFLSDKELNSIR